MSEASRKAAKTVGAGPEVKAPPAPAQAQEAPKPPAVVVATQLDAARFKGAEFQRAQWVVTAHAHNQPEDLLRPDYWAHVAARLGPWHHIEARANDGSWYAEYLVLEAGRAWARVHMLHSWRLTTADVALSQAARMSPYEIVFRGPDGLWSVVRKSDRAIVHQNEQTEGGALDWVNERLKADAR